MTVVVFAVIVMVENRVVNKAVAVVFEDSYSEVVVCSILVVVVDGYTVDNHLQGH